MSWSAASAAKTLKSEIECHVCDQTLSAHCFYASNLGLASNPVHAQLEFLALVPSRKESGGVDLLVADLALDFTGFIVLAFDLQAAGSPAPGVPQMSLQAGGI